MSDDLKPCRQRFCGAVSVGPPVECGAKAGQPCQRPDLQPSDAATITQLRADLDAANERAEKAEAERDHAVQRVSELEAALSGGVLTKNDSAELLRSLAAAEADAAALRERVERMREALRDIADPKRLSMSRVRDRARAALAPSAPDEGAK